jgi:hypothetical protein
MSKSSLLSNDARGRAQRTAMGAHEEVEAVITPGRKTGAEEGFESHWT